MESEFVGYALRQLEVLGPVVAKKLFGGHGLYCDGVIFAVIDDDVLYFKVDERSRADYVAAGMSPFQPLAGKRPMDGYYEVPLDVLGERAKLRAWATRALEVARAKRAEKPARATAAKLDQRARAEIAKPAKRTKKARKRRT